jgi:hypothetical protein
MEHFQPSHVFSRRHEKNILILSPHAKEGPGGSRILLSMHLVICQICCRANRIYSWCNEAVGEYLLSVGCWSGFIGCHPESRGEVCFSYLFHPHIVFLLSHWHHPPSMHSEGTKSVTLVLVITVYDSCHRFPPHLFGLDILMNHSEKLGNSKEF